MKSYNVEFSNDQSEFIERISTLCDKDATDFIREALICLLPMNEYIAVKKNLIVLQKDRGAKRVKDVIEKQIRDINQSLGKRLKHIGII
ncbi:MAG: hypothetical protein V2J62_05565 [candidate division KSB1 bacterium]|jgi:hypothetical protein|nr:hypothetical protein [candidate division KSB1 bacterium]